ncbi:unnamed protein product, partial [Sphenostylis stenocarpa]
IRHYLEVLGMRARFYLATISLSFEKGRRKKGKEAMTEMKVLDRGDRERIPRPHD